MKLLLPIVLLLISCNAKNPSFNKSDLTNETIINHNFLKEMYRDTYFPNFLVVKTEKVLIELAYNIEKRKPTNLEELYELTHQATIQINQLQNEFFENDSEIETAARESIASDIEFIATAYGFDADIEELIATREW